MDLRNIKILGLVREVITCQFTQKLRKVKLQKLRPPEDMQIDVQVNRHMSSDRISDSYPVDLFEISEPIFQMSKVISFTFNLNKNKISK